MTPLIRSPAAMSLRLAETSLAAAMPAAAFARRRRDMLPRPVATPSCRRFFSASFSTFVC
jgi:hypothetical protein